SYPATVARGIDPSGAVILRSPGFQAVSIAAKDCAAPCRYIIQGTEGYLMQETPANLCGEVALRLNGGGEDRFHTPTEHRMEMEFLAFARQMEAGDLEACYSALRQSLRVSRMLTRARKSAGIVFSADQR
ncbi:MAG: gfo/Idh/MocA family oxidoreductase, partial [Oscillospiraceae bacterium]|nr:gfo/Idh/MocA family oxidoreductase [Oscillospiraceae bacterium]